MPFTRTRSPANRSLSTRSSANPFAKRTPAIPNHARSPANTSTNRTPPITNQARSSANTFTNRTPPTMNHALSDHNSSDRAPPIASSPVLRTAITTPSSAASNLSLTHLSSASSSSSLPSAGPSSSPLARYGVNKSYKHVPSGSRLYQEKFCDTQTPHGRYKHENSELLQGAHLTLERLIDTCALCWATGAPDPQSHRFGKCPLMKDPQLGLRKAYADFRAGISLPKGTCYGCYIPKVRRSFARYRHSR